MSIVAPANLGVPGCGDAVAAVPAGASTGDKDAAADPASAAPADTDPASAAPTDTAPADTAPADTATTRIPRALLDALRPVTIICGHYGSGKTNFAVNLALDLAPLVDAVTLIDLDIVNPYFRATDERRILEAGGVRVIAPVLAERGTAIDLPNITGAIAPALADAGKDTLTLVDLGGDDVGSAVLGRFAHIISARSYAMLLVVNRHRNLTQDPDSAYANLREIEAATRLSATAIIDNSHLKELTDAAALADEGGFARRLSQASGLPVVAKTCPEVILYREPEVICMIEDTSSLYPIRLYIHNPWEILWD